MFAQKLSKEYNTGKHYLIWIGYKDEKLFV